MLLGVEVDEEKEYIYVTTMYPITDKKIENRVYSGKLINIKENKYYVYHDKCIKDLSNIVGTEDKEKIEIREDFHYQCHKCNKNYIM